MWEARRKSHSNTILLLSFLEKESGLWFDEVEHKKHNMGKELGAYYQFKWIQVQGSTEAWGIKWREKN